MKFLLQKAFGQILGIPAQHDVGAAAGHVGGDGDALVAAGLGDDVGFAVVVLGIQNLVGDAPTFQHPRQQFGFLNRDRAHQNRLSLLVELGNLLHDRLEFLSGAFINAIGIVCPLQNPVGGQNHAVQVVDLFKLVGFGVGGAGHAGKLFIHPKIILKGDGRQRLVFPFDLDCLLGFNGLMEAVRPAAARHHPAGEFIHNHHLAVADHIIHIQPEKFLGPQGLQNVVAVLERFHLMQVLHAKKLRRFRFARLGQGDRPGLLIREVIKPLSEVLIFGFGLDLVFLGGAPALKVFGDVVGAIIFVR